MPMRLPPIADELGYLAPIVSRQYRLENDMSQADLAAFIGCHKSNISDIERGAWRKVSRRLVRKVISLDEYVKLDIPFDRVVPYRDRSAQIPAKDIEI